LLDKTLELASLDPAKPEDAERRDQLLAEIHDLVTKTAS
jgi:hypothetical protein